MESCGVEMLEELPDEEPEETGPLLHLLRTALHDGASQIAADVISDLSMSCLSQNWLVKKEQETTNLDKIVVEILGTVRAWVESASDGFLDGFHGLDALLEVGRA